MLFIVSQSKARLLWISSKSTLAQMARVVHIGAACETNLIYPDAVNTQYMSLIDHINVRHRTRSTSTARIVTEDTALSRTTINCFSI